MIFFYLIDTLIIYVLINSTLLVFPASHIGNLYPFQHVAGPTNSLQHFDSFPLLPLSLSKFEFIKIRPNERIWNSPNDTLPTAMVFCVANQNIISASAIGYIDKIIRIRVFTLTCNARLTADFVFFDCPDVFLLTDFVVSFIRFYSWSGNSWNILIRIRLSRYQDI